MGYSCTVNADNVLRRTLNIVNGLPITDPCYGNTWEINGRKFFYERGREQADGSITGTIFLFTECNFARKYGSFKINADGTVKQWPGMPKNKIVSR